MNHRGNQKTHEPMPSTTRGVWTSRVLFRAWSWEAQLPLREHEEPYLHGTGACSSAVQLPWLGSNGGPMQYRRGMTSAEVV